MNVTYEYYKDSFGGSLIPESHWKSVEVKMSARLNRYTFDRMEEGAWPAKAKTALCEMCDCVIFMKNFLEILKEIKKFCRIYIM